jgi:hypothetical protein
MNVHKSLKTLALAAQVAALPACAAGQSTPAELETAVDMASTAWMGHNYRGLLAGSDTVRLQLPDVGRSPAVRPSHAVRVLRGYVESATEVSFTLRSIRIVNENHAYAEMARVYAVAGTADERVETVFLGFRRVDGEWRIREVRVTP